MKINTKHLFENFKSYENKEITINGWIKTIRSSNQFGFIEINDGTNFKNVQVVVEKDSIDNYEEVTKFHASSGIEVNGVLVLTPDMKQDFEIKATKVRLLSGSDGSYPLQKKRHSFEYLREIAHLRPRGNSFNAVFRLRSLISFAIHEFFQTRDFVYVNTPLITASDCEGAGEMFRVTTLDMKNPPLNEEDNIDYTKDFFGAETYLTVSGQLQAEAYALAFKNVYTFGPTFRAENSNTPRHAAEFWMVEPEIAFADLSDDMDLAEDLMKYVINYALEKAGNEIEFFNKFVDKGLVERLKGILNSTFKRITYTEAIEILKKADAEFEYPVEWGLDLQTEHERYLTEKHFGAPVFVTDYPKEIKAFYMRMNEDNKTVAAVDLLVPGVGEIIGGSQREERYDVLVSRMEELGMNSDSMDWYLDLRKYGGVKHAGFGLGFERLIMYLSGMKNIRDVIPFPRTVNNAKF
ncbi:asparagine--tRNA ligase [Anaerofustis stercorihominis]|uniref:asparagine--tRNA ligase n=1 Tax=Anaerofustis stercorihominis TaxID=214853 RepID=UPI00214CF940|nr:asparagine--tRNA ligase [Anaerofustis stercorihominis]